MAAPRDFVEANSTLQAVPYVPEIRLCLADVEVFALWERAGRLPFWAYAWAGGQALARHVLDHPEIVRGRTVLDLASGSGLVGIAAAMAGATRVIANDIDPHALAAIALNATANGVGIALTGRDLLTAAPLQGIALTGRDLLPAIPQDTALAEQGPLTGTTGQNVTRTGHGLPAVTPEHDVVLAGDVFYDAPLARMVMPFLERAPGTVLVGDPERTCSYLPHDRFEQVSLHHVPALLEARSYTRTTVFRLM